MGAGCVGGWMPAGHPPLGGGMFSCVEMLRDRRDVRAPVDPRDVEVGLEVVGEPPRRAEHHLLRKERVDGVGLQAQADVREVGLREAGVAPHGHRAAGRRTRAHLRPDVQVHLELPAIDEREREPLGQLHARAEVGVRDHREIGGDLVAQRRLVGLEQIEVAGDVEVRDRGGHERDTASDLQPRRGAHREVHAEPEALVAVVVQLPARLVLRERAHAGKPFVGHVQAHAHRRTGPRRACPAPRRPRPGPGPDRRRCPCRS